MAVLAIQDVKWARAWKARHPDFPLVVHPSGQWTKKVRGKVHYFGVLKDTGGALRLWLDRKDYLLAGLLPPAQRAGITVGGLLDRHLQDVDDRIAAGRLSRRTRRRSAPVLRMLRDSNLLGFPVASLTPSHLAVAMKTLEGRGFSLRYQKVIVTSTKTIFNWGYRMGLFDRVQFGPRFSAPSEVEIEAARENEDHCRFLERDMILKVIEMASPKIEVAILLGINCGFYQSDSVAIPIGRLHLDGEMPYHDFRRVKTGHRRMAALWPETVEAIRKYGSSVSNVPRGQSDPLLVAQGSCPYNRNGYGRELSTSFNRLLRKIGAYRKGVSIGSLRHTYGTVVDLVPDQAMIDLTMGHTNKSLQKRVYSQLNLNELGRLKAVADTVREWLYGKTEEST